MASQQQVIWTNSALTMLMEVGSYLADLIGQQKANIFVNELTAKTKKLRDNPGRYPPCRFKLLQANNFRCMRFKKYITVYREEKSAIYIYGVIYERRNPQIFNDLAKN